MDETGLPQPPKGFKWRVRRWEYDDFDVFPYPRFGRLAVDLVATGYNTTRTRTARALESPRSIRAAALRILRRHYRKEARTAQAARFAGDYPPKKLED